MPAHQALDPAYSGRAGRDNDRAQSVGRRGGSMSKSQQKPLFHVTLSDRDEWVVEAESQKEGPRRAAKLKAKPLQGGDQPPRLTIPAPVPVSKRAIIRCISATGAAS